MSELSRSCLLYHGTRYLDRIMRDNAIRCPITGDKHVSLTTDFRVALYWASLERDDIENESPGVVVLERKALLDHGHPLFLFDGTGQDDEAEVACPKDIDGLISLGAKTLRLEWDYGPDGSFNRPQAVNGGK